MQAAGRAAARSGPGADQDRREQDAQDLRLPNQRGLHHKGLGAIDLSAEETGPWSVVITFPLSLVSRRNECTRCSFFYYVEASLCVFVTEIYLNVM